MPLWDLFYSSVAHERAGGASSQFGETADMESVLRETLISLDKIGPAKLQLSRWFSFESRLSQFFSVGASAHQFILTYAMFLKGHWKRWDDTPMACGGKAVDVPEDDPIDVCVEGGCEEAAMEAEGDEPVKPEVSNTKKPEQLRVNRSISIAVSTLCQRMLLRCLRGVVEQSTPLRHMHGELLAQLKSPAGWRRS
eukprot:6482326-Amphidinium_carterae.1